MSNAIWTPQTLAGGFTQIPNSVLGINQYLPHDRQLSSTELLVLLQVLSYWWQATKLPFPSKASIARALGLSPRQVQRALGGIERKGFMRRIKRNGAAGGRSSNAYDLSSLVNQVDTISHNRKQRAP